MKTKKMKLTVMFLLATFGLSLSISQTYEASAVTRGIVSLNTGDTSTIAPPPSQQQPPTTTPEPTPSEPDVTKPAGPLRRLPDTGGGASILLSLLGAGVLLFLLFFLWKRRKKDEENENEQSQSLLELERVLVSE